MRASVHAHDAFLDLVTGRLEECSLPCAADGQVRRRFKTWSILYFDTTPIKTLLLLPFRPQCSLTLVCDAGCAFGRDCAPLPAFSAHFSRFALFWSTFRGNSFFVNYQHNSIFYLYSCPFLDSPTLFGRSFIWRYAIWGWLSFIWSVSCLRIVEIIEKKTMDRSKDDEWVLR